MFIEYRNKMHRLVDILINRCYDYAATWSKFLGIFQYFVSKSKNLLQPTEHQNL